MQNSLGVFYFVATDCRDDPAVDCAHMNTLFGICGDVNHAKVVCPRFCKLCNVGTCIIIMYYYIIISKFYRTVELFILPVDVIQDNISPEITLSGSCNAFY